MSKIHLITFKQKDQNGNKVKLESHVQKHAAKMAAKGLAKKPKIKRELKHTPRVFIIEDADDELLESLKNDPDVLAVEDDIIGYPDMAQNPPQWSHGMSDIGGFHSRGYTGAGVKVGVLDTGFGNHEDLVYAARYNAFDENPPSRDVRGHGTSVAGIIAMRNNTVGYVGVAPDCQLYGAKVASDYGSFPVSRVIDGLDWLVSQGVKIINCSFGFESDSSSMRAAFEDAYEDYDVLFICSAGNTAEEQSDPNDPLYKRYPASYDFVIAVGCIRRNGEIASYSTRAAYVDVSAPGDGVYTTKVASNIESDPTAVSTEYRSFNGTSCAAPHVTGIAALYKQMYPSYTADQIRNLIQSNVIDWGAVGGDITYGAGCVTSPWASKAVTRKTLTDTSMAGNLTAGKPDLYTFVPSQSGIYTFETTSSLDLKLDVYDSIGRRLGVDDDSGEGTNPMLAINLKAGETYYIGIYGYNGNQYGPYTLLVTPPGPSATPTVITETFESSALTIPFTGDWLRTTAQKYAGSYAYTNKDITHDQVSQTSFKVTVPAGANDAKLSFYYRVSSEENYDFLKVLVDTTEVVSASGSVGWTYKEVTLTPGTHDIIFKYQKDRSVDSGSDAAFIDNVVVSGTGVTVSSVGV